ncbi:hypothetical protein F3Y22_tig00110833pilonHSYRG00144 [Hibiscus syriacus]|uniref:Protamine P1 family protein n=1 Tax=Hibiscus syriacus TaxID=106335 RepID=A0A6A2ZKP4_HIBSY|nr:uncharacterized protein LOC120143132 [Hibiscus syriacus]KAE8692478.1 hypothetical protein F3Y22_tig00110833pilonHSYRG00144 [Hibiscus syriacus]
MKVLAKPISSPGRAEKYPPPLMRFLRSNVGSKSRGKSRTSPMFVRKKNAAIETQEPSSPKVTCMGQVRVKRSKKTSAKPANPTRRRRRGRCCKWIRNAVFCRRFLRKVKVRPAFRCYWKKWGAFLQMGCCGNPINTEDSSKFAVEDSNREVEDEDKGEEDEKEAKIFLSSSSSSPPKTALILTRCRSAPYKSSSLACRFWGSPLANRDKNDEETGNKAIGFELEEEDKPCSKTDSICRDSDPGTEWIEEPKKTQIFSRVLERKM